MGWFGGSSSAQPPSKVSYVSEYKEPEKKKPQQYLEDLPPKFEDSEPQSRPQTSSQPTLKDAAMSIRFSDFNVDRFVNMPCFREAMITGFQAMGVLGVVTFLIHKNPSKALNWSMGGFFLGNLVGWEQCRSLRRRSFEMVEKAKLEKEEKHKRKWESLKKSQDSDEDLKNFENFNSKK
ncbi:COX20 [Candida pseudojiufengensis]|uniref:COX20 n=1 Tax=Candida pseudojiufengensis TaxID=497109 RepID=UPI0022257B01|nr:COX20 [Candida pseudojiufengensis]KAI5960774.1 COX20 [Candida pseudojiufengensis]